MGNFEERYVYLNMEAARMSGVFGDRNLKDNFTKKYKKNTKVKKS